MQNDIMNQSWSSHHDGNNQFYQNYSHPTSNIPYDPHQYAHNHMSNTFINRSQQMLDERPSKKVQFAHPIQQRGSSMKAPLTSAQSWHDISPANNDMTNSITRQEPISDRQTIHRSVMPISDPSSSQVSQQKPIYVGIDYKATLAERGQATAPKRHHKTNEKNHSDAVDSNSRARPNTHHHHNNHRSQTSNDSSNSSSTQQQNRPSEPLQAKLSNPQRILTTTSTSTVIPNRQTQHMEQQSSFDNGIKIAKTRAIRTQPAQSTEQRSPPHDEIKSSRSKKHHSHNQQQQNVMEHRNGSPAYHETIRRVDNKQGTPVMQIPISQQQQQQQRQKQSSIPSMMTNSMNITRTRI
jgi:hypothetical protein